MNLETFFEKFDLFADCPNAVQKMRDVVLFLAVQGKLTEQLPEENVDSQLACLRKFVELNEIELNDSSRDAPFVVPTNWSWSLVGETMNMINGRAFKPSEWTTSGVPIIRIQNLNKDSAAFNFCQIEVDKKVHVNTGDLLISWSGTPGTSFGAFVWDRGFAYLNQHIFRCELADGVFDRDFLKLAINSRLDEMIAQAQGGVGLRHITKGKLEQIQLPLPPLAEQKRIVAKVDELMALCDALEAQQKERENKRAQLAKASLAAFADAPSPTSLELLFHPSFSIDPTDLRKSILTLAVQGKLVPQDPRDEPATALVANESEETCSDCLCDNELFAIPESWIWAEFSQVADIASNLVDPKCFPTAIHLAPDNIEKATGRLLPCRTVSEDEVKSSNHQFFAGQIIYSKIRPNLSKVVVVDFDGLCSADMYPINARIDSGYLLQYMLSESFLVQAVKTDTRIAMPKINQTELKRIRVSVPPLAEQKRIAAKVSELMALVDRLEAKIVASREVASRLLETMVVELSGKAAT
ncbi:MAG TPA: restriction endonuclease subunit S [Fibrobacteria bacterium]|nr:restriction endonuclease subunit S [Fibrobacteria bacterium]